jgi:hypothetical protein
LSKHHVVQHNLFIPEFYVHQTSQYFLFYCKTKYDATFALVLEYLWPI